MVREETWGVGRGFSGSVTSLGLALSEGTHRGVGERAGELEVLPSAMQSRREDEINRMFER